MQKMIRVIIVLGILSLIYQFIINFFLTNREYNYSLKNNNDEFIINEIYKKKNGYNLYTFKIVDKDNNTFIYDYEGDLNSQSKVIKNIESYKKDNLYCIAPVFKNKKIENIVCSYNNELVTYTYMQQIGNIEVDNFVNSLQTNYTVNTSYRDINNIKTDYQNISYYNDIDSNLYFSIWNYKSLYRINNNKANTVDLLKNDMYENEYAIACDKYYVTVDTDNGFNYYYIVNVKDGGKAQVYADDEVSNNIYINGCYKSKVYLTDIDNRKQYEIDAKHEKVTTLVSGKYYDGVKLNTVDISSLVNEKKYFTDTILPEEIVNLYGNDVKFANGNYYFIHDNKVYKIVGDNYNEKILLFVLGDSHELKALNNNIYIISGSTVYMYNNHFGLKKVIEDRELIYNYKNIFNVYEKR